MGKRCKWVVNTQKCYLLSFVFYKMKISFHSCWEIYSDTHTLTNTVILMVSYSSGLPGIRYYAKNLTWIISCYHQTTLRDMCHYLQAMDGELKSQWGEVRWFVQGHIDYNGKAKPELESRLLMSVVFH